MFRTATESTLLAGPAASRDRRQPKEVHFLAQQECRRSTAFDVVDTPLRPSYAFLKARRQFSPTRNASPLRGFSTKRKLTPSSGDLGFAQIASFAACTSPTMEKIGLEYGPAASAVDRYDLVNQRHIGVSCGDARSVRSAHQQPSAGSRVRPPIDAQRASSCGSPAPRPACVNPRGPDRNGVREAEIRPADTPGA